MASTTSSPLVLRGPFGRRARLRSGELLLESRSGVRRIPVGAVERVEVRGRFGRTLAVVLTADEPGGATTYTQRSYSAPATDRFAAAVRRALPVRDAEEPRPDGALSVTSERRSRRGRRPVPERLRGIRPGTALAVAFCLVLAALLATRSWGGALTWVFVPLLVGAGVSLAPVGWKPVREGWILATRGITVEGHRRNSGAIDAGDTTAMYVYLFDDAEGTPRAYRGVNGGRDDEEITYDPLDPGIAQLRRRNAAQLALGSAVLLVLVLPLLGGGLALALLSFADLLGGGPVTDLVLPH
ncbi:hypothetical protein [Streptomyces sp. SP18CS02]|uniref:hypothetical protein n=1 Tax=Streptomyces sp. SP18CS02 TaxID=3002531 RepID=UPI002E7A2527|nr:hypothetical protein [Streptomyces sp. SP18CS02]MEE1755451.1 hypothetical protein [Streptomyces sp. SP18CS02]